MARYYGTVSGAGSTRSTRTGTRSTGLETSAQTYTGSLIVHVSPDENDNDLWDISVDESGSSTRGRLVFIGTLQELVNKLEK